RVDAAHQHLAFDRRAGWVVATDQRHRHGGDAAGPLLDPFGTATGDSEVGRAAGRTPPRRLAHHAPDAAAFEPEHAEARGARRRFPAGPAYPGDPIAADRLEDERARGRAERPEQAGRPALGTRLDDLDGRPRPAGRLDQDMVTDRGLERRAERGEDARGPHDLGP